MDTPKPVTHVSLCAGYGGIDLGLKRAIPNLRTIAFSEIEAFACANLVAKMEAGYLDAAPIWTDVKTFPWEEFRGKVDILSGGYPCQPFSAAGKRLGKDDPRHLWPWIADGIRVCRPAVCFFENVEGHISLGLQDVIRDLGNRGYTATWGLFSAAEVGAPHQRKRVFILAHRIGERGLVPHQWRVPSEQMPFRHGQAGRVVLADGIQPGLQGCAPEQTNARRLQCTIGRSGDNLWPSRPGQPQHEWEPPRVVGNTKSQRSPTFRTKHEGQRGELCPSCTSGQGVVGNADCRRFASRIDAGSSRETDGGRQGDVEQTDGSAANASGIDGQWRGARIGRGKRGQSDVAAVQCAGNGYRQTQPTLGGNADGPAGGMDYAELCISGDNRTDELRLLGNGVVPATAERAFTTLMQELFP